MRAPIAVLILFLSCISSFGQSAGSGLVSQRIESLHGTRTVFSPVDLFTREPSTPATDALWSGACRTAVVLRYDRQAAQALITADPEFIALSIPTASGSMTLDLERARVTADDFVVRTASDGRPQERPACAHYRGMIRGVPGSLVAISVFQEELMGLVSDVSGEQVIGRFERAPADLHVFYHERDLRGTSGAMCGADGHPVEDTHDPHTAGAERTMRCVHFYWEAANDIFVNKGSVANVTSYLTGLFNQSATIFANDGVDVLLQEVFVWDVASPYNGTSSGSRLSQFGTTRTSFNGDLAHLLDYGGYGGVAWLSSLCGGTSSRMAYSGIYSSYSNVPTYGWSVEVVTHEQGHNLGSSHTHACVWNGNSTAIDGCGPLAGYTEGSCPTGPQPPSNVGGTIMSYCHLTGSGINFVNGFGPQPKQVIIDRVNSSSCLASCGTSCDAPGSRYVSPLAPTTGTLNWANVGAVSYTVRWKAQASGTWNEVSGLTGTTCPITGLTQATAYEFQVLSVCTASSSAYSTSTNFTTPVPCPDAMEPNNTLATAAAITLPTAVNALIATASDQDYYTFTLAAASNVNLYLGNVAADYDLYLLSSTGTTLASSIYGGTSSESIGYSAAAGTYVIQVVGYQGAFSGTQCYLLNASAYVSSSCSPPTGLGSSAVTYNSATVSWNTLLTASGYDLRWKASSLTTWTDVPGLTTNTCNLTGLQPLTSYGVQVRTLCTGGQPGASSYTETYTFITPAAPCDVVPPMVVAAKVLLEGPFKSAEGLMVDSLRKQGWLPLTEPYTALGLPVSGATTTTAGVLASTGSNAIVDWVVVELRNASIPSTVVERKAGLVQRDGDVVGVDGSTPLGFCSTPGAYYVAVRHRNHQGCMSGQAITLNGVATPVDFTATATGTYGSNARKQVGAVMTLWAGNTNGDVNVKYTGTGNDRDPILVNVGSTTPNNTVSGYLLTDVNMDGLAKYTGTGNDRDPILLNVGSTTPNSVRAEQLP